MAMLRLLTLAYQKKISLVTMRLKVFVELLSISHLKLSRDKVMVKQQIGGHLEELFMRCYVVNHLSTIKIKRNFSKI